MDPTKAARNPSIIEDAGSNECQSPRVHFRQEDPCYLGIAPLAGDAALSPPWPRFVDSSRPPSHRMSADDALREYGRDEVGVVVL